MEKLELFLDYNTIEGICEKCFDASGLNNNESVSIVDTDVITLLRNLDRSVVYIKHVRLRSPLKLKVTTGVNTLHVKPIDNYLIKYSGTIDFY